MSSALQPGDAPLKGVTVVEFCQALAGPYCTALLADFGARVIKIEKPGGDDSRSMPPHFVGDSSVYYMGPNRSKESLVLDLKSQEGRELALKLVEKADIVVENNRPGVMERLGLGFEAMKARNPAVVLVSVTGFGQDGPYRDLPAYDSIVQAMSGVMSLTGEPDGNPVRAGAPIGDLCAGMNGALGALAALRIAQATGQAQHVDVSMLDTQVSLVSYHLMYYLHAGEVAERTGNGHAGVPELGEFKCADGHSIMVAPMGEQIWPRLCAAVGREDLATRADLAIRKDRVKIAHVVRKEFEETYKQRPAAEWVERLRAHGVPVSTINTMDLVAADPQVRHRKMLHEVEYQGHPLTVIGNGIQFAGVETVVRGPPELSGEAERILREDLGLSAEQVSGFVERGVVALRKEPVQA